MLQAIRSLTAPAAADVMVQVSEKACRERGNLAVRGVMDSKARAVY